MKENPSESHRNRELKVAIVTGAGTGIGRATAVALHAAEYQLVLAGRRTKALEETRELLRSDGPDVIVCSTDVSIEQDVIGLFDLTVQTFGRLDLLFNNAGVAAPNLPPEELSLEQWQDVLNANLTGPFLCTRQAIRVMKNQNPKGGRIINNGSIAATTPRPLSSPYAVSKHGITGLTKSTALDCRDHNIAVCQIDIGNAGTEMAMGVTRGALQSNGQTEKEPIMDVEHVANTIVHMDSLPLDANMLFVTVMATNMPFVGRG